MWGEYSAKINRTNGMLEYREIGKKNPARKSFFDPNDFSLP
jgi:hypothetical protein